MLVDELTINMQSRKQTDLILLDFSKTFDKVAHETLIQKAGDIYTAVGWESTLQNGYLHGSPLRFSAKLAIYTAAGCQHKIAMYTATVQEPNRLLFIAAGCIHKTVSYTAAGRGYIHGCRMGVHVSKWLFTRQPFKIHSQIGYMHGSQVLT